MPEFRLSPDCLLYSQQARLCNALEVSLVNESCWQLLLDQHTLHIRNGWRWQISRVEWLMHPLGNTSEHVHVRLVANRWVRQRAQHFSTIEGITQSLVQQNSGSSIVSRADQTPKALLEDNDHLWQQVVIKGILTGILHRTHTSRLNWIAKTGIRQLLQEDIGK